ncbi:CoA-binding protein [Silicimonas algicola]|uniref:Acyl-CoA synthetase (NDP forming) n=1 Tax=Silicimonas algicola TaxID=1826607 RepID=A0A316G3T6_9RHOB|nr:acetate--CoA ligase [Silicimonas algicola]AZQ68278.1 CoA-binding protein [Silicimonas algicola]PWK54586.1 acyl-CoA synthetase (NDP forming) [Silicimonas algicola]
MTPDAPDLGRLISPRGIAVVGASDNARSVGGQPMIYLTSYGYAGTVHPVNPTRVRVMGLPCVPSVRDVPDPCDVALVAVAAHRVADVIRDCGARGIPFAVILSSGFREAGPDGQLLEANLASVARAAGVRLVGPNCMGVLNIPEHIHCGFGQGFRVRDYIPGPVAMATQSGGYGFTLLRNASREKLGFNHVVSVGNSIDLDALDFVGHFLERDDVRIVTAFLEGVRDGRRLLTLGRRALALGKPILVWKVGNTPAGRTAAASHTASLTSSYDLFRAAFREGGIIELRDYEDLVDVARGFLGGRLPRGPRVGLVSGSGGAGVIAADRFSEAGLTLPAWSDATRAALRDGLGPFSGTGNPIDLSGEGSRDGRSLSNIATDIVLADDGVDMVMVRSGQTSGSAAAARALAAIRDAADKPVLVATVAEDHAEGKAALDAAGVPWFLTVGRAATAARALATFAAAQAAPPGDPSPRPLPRPALELPDRGGFLSEGDSRPVLAAYGIPQVRTLHVAGAVPANHGLCYPLAVKANCAGLPHKTEAGAVRLNLPDLASVRAAAREVTGAACTASPDTPPDGVLLQEMTRGTELILGAMDDACFGPIVMVGLGGVFAELLRDTAYGFAPVSAATARAMIDSLRGKPLLDGWRGAAPADRDSVADALVRLSWLIADHRDRIAVIDINPLFVEGDTVLAADAVITLKDLG